MAKPPASILSTALIALLIAWHVWLGWSATLEKGPAFDESAHLTAGYSYWKFNDYRLQPENGNLPQRWAGLAVAPLAPRLAPAEDPSDWGASDVWMIGHRFLFETGNPTELMLAASRGAMILWGVAVALLVFFWARGLWGLGGGLLSLALCAGSATMLAHGPMVTSDMAAAFCLVAASGAFWRYLRRPSPVNLSLSLLLTSAAAIAKFSFVLLVPIYALLLVWSLCLRRPSGIRIPFQGGPAMRGFKVIGLISAHTLAAMLVVWAAFGFRHKAAAPTMPPVETFYIPWEALIPQDDGPRRAALVTLKESRLLPEAYVHGFAYVLAASEKRGAFAAGQVSSTGWWWFFPYTFLLKSSLAELLAAAALLTIALRRWAFSGQPRRMLEDLEKAAPLVVFAVVYGLVSITSNLNIGHRHILPLYLPLFIMAGALARATATRTLRIFAVSLALAQAGEACVAYPNYLAYFNPLAGSSDQRWRHLVDSSLDWGQELPALSKWLADHRRPDEPVFLSYFGVADPRREGMKVIQFAPYSSQWRAPRLATLRPGLYCVSATLLQDAYSPLNGPWTLKQENTFQSVGSYFARHPEEFDSPHGYALMRGTFDDRRRWLFERARFARLAQYLRVRRPDAVINSAMLVYRLDEREISLAVDASTSMFRTLIEEAYHQR